MMNEHRTEVRLTPEQRDRVLDLAARLQAQHEATIGISDLAQAAAEAGIDPRFVHQAAQTLVTPPATPLVTPVVQAETPDRNVAFTLIGVLGLLNLLVALTPLVRLTATVGGLWLVLLAAVAAYWSVRARLSAFLAPATIFATMLGIRTFMTMRNHYGWDPDASHMVRLQMIQIAVALLVGVGTKVFYALRSLARPQPGPRV